MTAQDVADSQNHQEQQEQNLYLHHLFGFWEHWLITTKVTNLGNVVVWPERVNDFPNSKTPNVQSRLKKYKRNKKTQLTRTHKMGHSNTHDLDDVITDPSATESDSSATKTDSGIEHGNDDVSSPPSDSCPFSIGEKVLVYHNTRIYDAKVKLKDSTTHIYSLEE